MTSGWQDANHRPFILLVFLLLLPPAFLANAATELDAALKKLQMSWAVFGGEWHEIHLALLKAR